MGADNWSICPDCVKRAKALRDLFIEKYYGELNSFIFTELFEEIESAVTHIESYSSDEYSPNPEMLKLGEEKKIFVKYNGQEYDVREIMQESSISCSLREDYEQGVNDEGLIIIRYSCSCDCGFNKEYKYNETE